MPVRENPRLLRRRRPGFGIQLELGATGLATDVEVSCVLAQPGACEECRAEHRGPTIKGATTSASHWQWQVPFIEVQDPRRVWARNPPATPGDRRHRWPAGEARPAWRSRLPVFRGFCQSRSAVVPVGSAHGRAPATGTAVPVLTERRPALRGSSETGLPATGSLAAWLVGPAFYGRGSSLGGPASPTEWVHF